MSAQTKNHNIGLGVLASGRGSNLQAIIDSIEAGSLAADLRIVVCNHPGVAALERARKHGAPAITLSGSVYRDRSIREREVVRLFRERGVELVVCAGYDRIVGPDLLNAFPEAVINIHPSLLPAFGGGLHAQADALAYGAKVSGCTVHFVTADVDAGPIIVQRSVPVLDDDTPDALASRILEQEHQALPEAIGLIASGRLTIDGRRVRVAPA